MGIRQIRHTSAQCGGEREVKYHQERERSNDDQVARMYNAMVIAGKVQSAVQQATKRMGGGLLDPFDIDVKTGNPVY